MSDAQDIRDLANSYAERGRMLQRSLESVYDLLRSFQVAEANGGVIDCVAVDVSWADLAEVKSLAVAPLCRQRRVGSRLVRAAIRDARRLGAKKLFALTYEKEFFSRHGFKVVHRDALPDKVWRECITCPKAYACDETAMMLKLDG